MLTSKMILSNILIFANENGDNQYTSSNLFFLSKKKNEHVNTRDKSMSTSIYDETVIHYLFLNQWELLSSLTSSHCIHSILRCLQAFSLLYAHCSLRIVYRCFISGTLPSFFVILTVSI